MKRLVLFALIGGGIGAGAAFARSDPTTGGSESSDGLKNAALGGAAEVARERAVEAGSIAREKAAETAIHAKHVAAERADIAKHKAKKSGHPRAAKALDLLPV